jgi:hypothetical protein
MRKNRKAKHKEKTRNLISVPSKSEPTQFCIEIPPKKVERKRSLIWESSRAKNGPLSLPRLPFTPKPKCDPSEVLILSPGFEAEIEPVVENLGRGFYKVSPMWVIDVPSDVGE